jgi:hypothetical protein
LASFLAERAVSKFTSTLPNLNNNC